MGISCCSISAIMNVTRPGSCPADDGLNCTGIDFLTLVSQFNKLEKQNPNLCLAGKMIMLLFTDSRKRRPYSKNNVNAERTGCKQTLQLCKKGFALYCTTKVSIMRVNISVNVDCMDTKEWIHLKDTKLNAKGC